jgi:uncharacterized membrane protein YraQ (UPF0718 family)
MFRLRTRILEVLALLLLVGLVGVAFAQGKTSVTGKVKGVAADSKELTLTDSTGKEWKFQLGSVLTGPKSSIAGTDGKSEDVGPGDDLTVSYTEKNGKLIAQEVRLVRGASLEDRARDFILTFTSILWEALPFIVLGAVIAGFLEELVPQEMVARLIPRNHYLAIGVSALLGMVFPMCECGIIPVMRRLLRKGLPLSCCTAYLLAGPIINVVVILSTWVAFSARTGTPGQTGGQLGSGWMVGLRVGLGYLVAVVTSLIVEWQYRVHGNKLLAPAAVPPSSALPVLEDNGSGNNGKRRSVLGRLGNISETALHDFVDITVFLILGGLLAALVRQVIPQDEMARLSSNNWVLAIFLMMVLALLLCLCSEADAFVAASFTALPAASKVAFLVLGPMLDLKLYMMYTRVFRPRLIWTIITAVAVQVFVYSIITHIVLDQYGLSR